MPLPSGYLEIHILQVNGRKPIPCTDGLPHPGNDQYFALQGKETCLAP